jgi:integrase/recombinase XerD
LKSLSRSRLRADETRRAASLETLYSTGVRRQELIDLKLYDLDAARGVILVREGKGKKDRMIPIGARALSWIERYVERARPELASSADDGTLFLATTGRGHEPAAAGRDRALPH